MKGPRKPYPSTQQFEEVKNFNHFTKFVYKKSKKYLKISEQKVDNDIFYLYGIEEFKILKSYLLDEDLNVFWQGNYCRDLAEELQKKVIALEDYQSHNFRGQNISDFSQEFDQDGISLHPIQYKRYPATNNFMIGRNHFVRDIKSHKIQSQSISKQHCEITHIKSNSEKVLQYLKTIKNVLSKRSPIFSNLRQISSELWQNILAYVKPQQKYILSDLGSRNGTLVYEIGTQIYRLKQKFEYQFQKQTYSIFVIKIFNSIDSLDFSVLEHNRKAHEIIEEFKRQVNWNYYTRVNKTMLLQNADKIQKKQDEKVQILIFTVKYRDYHQFYLLQMSESCTQKRTVGCKYQIDVNPQEYDSPSLHGKIYLQKGTWMIESFQTNSNGEYRKIWTRLPKNYKYTLDPEKGYKLRLSSSFFMVLNFHNF